MEQFCREILWIFSLDYHTINSAPCLVCQVAFLSIWIGKQPCTPLFKWEISVKSQNTHTIDTWLNKLHPLAMTAPQFPSRKPTTAYLSFEDIPANVKFILQTGISVRALKAPATFSAKMVLMILHLPASSALLALKWPLSLPCLTEANWNGNCLVHLWTVE